MVGLLKEIVETWGDSLSGVTLMAADLRNVYLNKADLREAYLAGADLGRAYLNGADLRGANLREARGLKWERMAGVIIDGTTQLPDYLGPRSSRTR